MEKIKFIDLFCGIGGFRVAMDEACTENNLIPQCVFSSDIDKYCQDSYENNFGHRPAGDITQVDPKSIPDHDILFAGFPCQPFSVAGQRKGADDNRYLWPHMLRAIHEIRPDWVIGENVAGILTMVQPGQETEVGSQSTLFGESEPVFKRRQQYVVETICRDLEREGYSVQPVLIPACSVGAPHRRDRVWFIAHRDGTGLQAQGAGQQHAVHQRAQTVVFDHRSA